MSIFSTYYQKDVSRLIDLLTPGGVSRRIVTHKSVGKSAKTKVDYLFFNDALSYADDIQNEVKTTGKWITKNGRIIVISFSFLWKPLLDLATFLGLREKIEKEPNWLTPADIENLFRLEGYELVRKGNRFLLPIDLGFVSTFFNSFLCQLPLINEFCLTTFQIFSKPKGKTNYSTSVIIPARNEAGHIKNVLAKIPPMGKSTEVIFVEGNSKDNTYKAIKTEIARYQKSDDKRLSRISLYKQKGVGKGDAVRLGFAKAKGDLFIIQDGDLTVDPANLPKFYNAIANGQAEFVNGSRLVYPMEKDAMRTLNHIGNKFFSIAFTYLLGQNIKDTLCGTKALLKTDYYRIAKNRATFGNFDPFGDFDLLFGASKLNLKIAEVPVRYKERVYGRSNISRFTHALLLLKMTLFAAKKLKFV